MNNKFKKILIGIVASAMCVTGSIGALPTSAAELDTPYTEEEIMEVTTIEDSFDYVLNNTNQQYEIDISAPSNSAAIFSFYTIPSKGTVTLYVKATNSAGASATYNRVFDSTGHAPALNFSINAGTTYYIYLKGSTSGISGTMNYSKTTA